MQQLVIAVVILTKGSMQNYIKDFLKVTVISMFLAYMLMSPIFDEPISLTMSVLAYFSTVALAASSFFASQVKRPYQTYVAYSAAVLSFLSPFLCMLAVGIRLSSALGYSIALSLFISVSIHLLIKEEPL